MTGELTCSSCYYYRVTDPGNVKQGECRRYPPMSHPIPMRGVVQQPNQANFVVMMVPRQVPHDHYCGEYTPEPPKQQ